MKILHLIGGGDVGGAKTHILSLLKGLQAENDVLLCSLRGGPFAEEAQAMGILTRIIASGNILKDFTLLRRIYQENGFDLVHCHGAKGNMMGSMLKLASGAKVLTTLHSDYRLDYLGRPLANLTFGMINRVALRIIKNRVCVSVPVEELLLSKGFSPYGLFSINNGLDFTVRERTFDRTEALRSFGLNPDPGDIVCGIAARLSPVKDLPTLLKAFTNLPPNIKLLIAGDGEDAASLKELSNVLDLEDRVCFAGWVEDTDLFYRCIDINVLTSLSEGFPYAIIEGARHGKATISSRVGGIPRLINDRVNGFLFEPGDVRALANRIRTLADDEELRRDMGGRIFEKASRDYSIESMVSRQNAIYRTILRRSKFGHGERRDVTICGAYGKNNAGDDAILEAIVSEIREIDPDIRIHVLTRTPKKTAQYYRVDALYTFNLLALFSAFLKSRLYINGGGNLMQDVTSTRSLLFYLFTIRFGKAAGCRVMMYGCGIGPISGPQNRMRTSRTLNECVDAITLREDGSLQELKNLGVIKPEIHLSADPALTLPPASESEIDSLLLANGVDPKGRYIGFVLRKWPSFAQKSAVFADAAHYAYERYGLTAVFIPIDPVGDVEAAGLTAKSLGTPFHVVEKSGTSGHVIGMLSRMSLVVSMRLHGLIFAASQGVPLIGVAYDPKVSSFLEYMNQRLCAAIETVTPEELRALIDQAMQKTRAELLAEVAVLKGIEHINSDIAAKILRAPEAPL